MDENPGKKSTQATIDKIGENVYYSVFTTQILEQLEKEGVYNLKEGDHVFASVKNTTKSMSEQMKSIIYAITGNDAYSISASQSGLVIANANNYKTYALANNEPEEPIIELDEPDEPNQPIVEPDDPIVEPDDPIVEPDQPTIVDEELKIGYYVEYNVAYEDVYREGMEYTADNGWRVLSAGTKNEDGSYKNVKLISTGVPLSLEKLKTDYMNNSVVVNQNRTIGLWGANSTQISNFNSNEYPYYSTWILNMNNRKRI